MLKKMLLLLLSTGFIACSSLQHTQEANEVAIQDLSLFYYYVDPKYPSEPTALLRGRFEKEDHCLYFIGTNGKRMTPLFPEYPKNTVNWDKHTNELIINNHSVKLGENITVNGGYQMYAKGSKGGKVYEQQGKNECLTPLMVKIGTSIE